VCGPILPMLMHVSLGKRQTPEWICLSLIIFLSFPVCSQGSSSSDHPTASCSKDFDLQSARVLDTRVPIGATVRPFGYEAGPMACGNGSSEVTTSVDNLAAALDQAIKDCGSPAFRRMQQACMSADVGWAGPAASWHAYVEEVASVETA
jgi:hypothetical protein